MLPFLKLKQSGVAGLIMKNRAPDEHKAEGGEVKEEKKEESEHSESRMACARDLLRAIESKDAKGIADALYDAFTIMDSEPHVEGEHVSPHSYDAQNKKAAQENE